jgi:hypothetical protein
VNWFRAYGATQRNADGKPLRFAGSLKDMAGISAQTADGKPKQRRVPFRKPAAARPRADQATEQFLGPRAATTTLPAVAPGKSYV